MQRVKRLGATFTTCLQRALRIKVARIQHPAANMLANNLLLRLYAPTTYRPMASVFARYSKEAEPPPVDPKPESSAKKNDKHPTKDPFARFPENTNPKTGEVGGPTGPEPTRYGDWERKGRVTDF